MQQSKWDQYDIEARVIAILSRVRNNNNNKPHPFKRPFLTAIQLAIAFAEAYPAKSQVIGLPVGGQGAGQHNSLAHYPAGQLVKRIKGGHITQIEGAFVSKNNISELRFRTGQGKSIVSSLTDVWDVSMFRLRPQG